MNKESLKRRIAELEKRKQACKGWDDPRFFKKVDGIYYPVNPPEDNGPKFRFVKPGKIDS